MTTPETPQEWLDETDLPTKLAKAFDDKGKRQVRHTACWLCSIGNCTGCEHYDINIDWNTAKYWQGKCDEEMLIRAAIEVFDVMYPERASTRKRVYEWLANLCKPEDARLVLIIAAMAERNKE